MLHVHHDDLKTQRIESGEPVLIEYCESDPYDIVEACDYVLSKNAFPFPVIMHDGYSYVKTKKSQLASPTTGIKILSGFNREVIGNFIFTAKIDLDAVLIQDTNRMKDLIDHLKRHDVEFKSTDLSGLEEIIRTDCELFDFKTNVVKSNYQSDDKMLNRLYSSCMSAIRKNGYDDRYTHRLGSELDVYHRMGFLGTLYDVQLFRKCNPRMLLRGSGNNSLVLFLLGVSDIDPIRYALPFERFVNHHRIYDR